MLSVVLEFDVIDGKEQEFVSAWTECTKAIYENFGSLGSRLHKSEHGSYIAYAQWPNNEVYEKSGAWPAHLLQIRDRMRATLKEGKPTLLYKLMTEVDLLSNTQYNNA
ncbi:antibiotic biosynthesis monooxygenase family protein [Cellvibrio mixtus]|uniref:antibiotic biosynthesis monooxygenase family protein n=1 Tax=Cellvibrio mixtus TaxID=39650 RepID=UPI0006948DD6|nr:antibiotic biosynthesis monooxygenase [Cellvibrio mixtus]